MAGLPTVSRPTVPSPFDMERMDISDRFRPMQDYTDPSSYTPVSSRDDDPSGPGAYTGSLNVTGLGGNVAERFVGMPQGLSTAIGPTGLGPFVALGTALSSRNLTSIQNKQRQGEAGYAVGMLNGRIIGVSPGAFGGYSLSGVLPEGLTVQQRNEIAEQLLAMSGPRFQPDEGVGGSSGDIPDPDTGLTIAEIEAGAGNFRPGIDTPFTPTPTPGGTTVVTGHPGVDQGPTYIPPDTSITYTPDPGEDSSPPGNQYSLPSGPAPGYTPPPDPGYYGDPGDDSDNTSPATGGADRPSYDGPPSSGGGGGFQDTGGFGPGGFRAKGGTVQRTGFVEGSPDNYAKGDTVADTVKTQVREGSFVLNAPTVEKLQQAGMLPKGVDNSNKNATIKANKGGLMDVALSKGEYVIEPEEAQRIGYSFLEKINDQGKAEVDRRQAAADGGSIGAKRGGFLGFLFGYPPEMDVTQEQQPSDPAPAPQTPPAVSVKPSTPLPERTSFEQTSRDLLEVLEDNKTNGYVPEGRSKSGVTIGIGFDIGQHSVADLERMGLSSDIIAKFTPYVNKTGQAAKNALTKDPLSLSDAEVEDVNTIVLRKKYEGFEKRYPKYANIPDEGKRAVMFSAYYGGGLNRYKTFRKEFDQAQNMKRAIKKGLIDIIPRGAAEYNRARKALDWYSDYELENMSRPISKPNSSATR